MPWHRKIALHNAVLKSLPGSRTVPPANPAPSSDPENVPNYLSFVSAEGRWAALPASDSARRPSCRILPPDRANVLKTVGLPPRARTAPNPEGRGESATPRPGVQGAAPPCQGFGGSATDLRGVRTQAWRRANAATSNGRQWVRGRHGRRPRAAADTARDGHGRFAVLQQPTDRREVRVKLADGRESRAAARGELASPRATPKAQPRGNFSPKGGAVGGWQRAPMSAAERVGAATPTDGRGLRAR